MTMKFVEFLEMLNDDDRITIYVNGVKDVSMCSARNFKSKSYLGQVVDLTVTDFVEGCDNFGTLYDVYTIRYAIDPNKEYYYEVKNYGEDTTSGYIKITAKEAEIVNRVTDSGNWDKITEEGDWVGGFYIDIEHPISVEAYNEYLR